MKLKNVKVGMKVVAKFDLSRKIKAGDIVIVNDVDRSDVLTVDLEHTIEGRKHYWWVRHHDIRKLKCDK